MNAPSHLVSDCWNRTTPALIFFTSAFIADYHSGSRIERTGAEMTLEFNASKVSCAFLFRKVTLWHRPPARLSLERSRPGLSDTATRESLQPSLAKIISGTPYAFRPAARLRRTAKPQARRLSKGLSETFLRTSGSSLCALPLLYSC